MENLSTKCPFSLDDYTFKKEDFTYYWENSGSEAQLNIIYKGLRSLKFSDLLDPQISDISYAKTFSENKLSSIGRRQIVGRAFNMMVNEESKFIEEFYLREYLLMEKAFTEIISTEETLVYDRITGECHKKTYLYQLLKIIKLKLMKIQVVMLI